jgi:hypothetical protein
MNEATGNGKVERLPWEIREEVCRRLRDNQPGSKIIAWLHSLPEVLQVLDEYFGEEPISPQNLSNFRQGGYRRWLARQGKVDRTRELAQYAMEISKAGAGSIADGASQIMAGNILEVMEALEGLRFEHPTSNAQHPTSNEEREAAAARVAAAAEAIDGLALAVSRLRKGDHDAASLRLNREKLAQAEKALELEERKFRRTTCEMFLKWRDDRRATEIADGPGSTDEKVEALGQHIFGDLWK